MQYGHQFIYSATISVCDKVKQLGKMVELLGRMRQKGLEPDGITYSVTISACEKAEHLNKAMELLVRYSRKAWHPTPSHTAQFAGL